MRWFKFNEEAYAVVRALNDDSNSLVPTTLQYELAMCILNALVNCLQDSLNQRWCGGFSEADLGETGCKLIPELLGKGLIVEMPRAWIVLNGLRGSKIVDKKSGDV